MKNRGPISLLLLVALLILTLEQPAQAYTDPGSGILIWQGIASGFVAVLFYWRKIYRWVFRKRDNRD